MASNRSPGRGVGLFLVLALAGLGQACGSEPDETISQGQKACELWLNGDWEEALEVAYPIRSEGGAVADLYTDMANSYVMGADMVPQCDDPTLHS